MRLFKILLNIALEARAKKIFFWLADALPSQGKLLDMGSGTGHNGSEIKNRTRLFLTELDVTDISMTGTSPLLYHGKYIPLSDRSYDCTTLIFVLQYLEDPITLLKELKRITSGNVIILQTIYLSTSGKYLLSAYEFMMGRLPYYLLKLCGLFPNSVCSLKPVRQYSADHLESLFKISGLTISHAKNKGLNLFGITHRLYILK